VNKLIQALLLVIIGLAVLASASRPLARLTGALVPLVLIVGVGEDHGPFSKKVR
jgi:hypothetical protein